MKKKFYVIVHNIRSAYNVGSIFRTADAFGVDKIFLTGYTPSPDFHKKVLKTALGAEKMVEWEKCWHIHKVINNLKKQKVKIYALEQNFRSNGIDNFLAKSSVALILGNEVRGLSSKVLEMADEIIEIPMFGKKESLNVSVAFGVAGYIFRNKLNR